MGPGDIPIMSEDKKRPPWRPEHAGRASASRLIDGRAGGHDGMPGRPKRPADGIESPPKSRRRTLSIDDYVSGVRGGDRSILGRAITLVESNAPAHMDQAQEMLKRLLPYTENSIRVGVTGYPGAGKSTLIEALGNFLCDRGHRVAVLAVDPSSSITKGSILGDKTRMERLSHRREAFIRPSPSSGVLGGVARKSRETILVCEAAGYDVILVETLGVGQSEITVRSMVDFFLLVLIAGAGDELQGLKKGVMELADALVINKADGNNLAKAEAARSEFSQVLHYLQPATDGWTTRAYTCSALNGEGIPELWGVVEDFRRQTTQTDVFQTRRRRQTMDWVQAMVQDYLRASFFNHPGVKKMMPQVERDVLAGTLSPTMAVQQLVQRFERGGE